MNIDERLNRYKTPLSKTTLMLTEQDVKQLIWDVLEEVTPKPKKPTNPMMAGYWNATEYMKGKRKELGL